MDVEAPDFLFADSILAALLDAGALHAPGVSIERERGRYRADRREHGRSIFVGYFPLTGAGLILAAQAARGEGGIDV